MNLPILILLSVVGVNGFYYNTTPYLSFIKDDVAFLNYYNPFFNQSIDLLQTLSTSTQINPQCRSSLKRWIDGLENREHWALKFLEATGKTINGKLVGRIANFGSFDYCTMFYANPSENIDFDGKYCMISVQTKEVETIKHDTFQNYYEKLSERSRRLIDFSMGNSHGICIPSTCKIEELIAKGNDLLRSHGLNVMAPVRCTTPSEPEPWTKLQIISLTILLTFVSLCILSQFVQNEFLSNFSLKKNWNVIYNFEATNEEVRERKFLHGAKTLMLFVSVLVHSFFLVGVFWAPSFAPLKEIEEVLPTQMVIVLERFIPLAGQMFFFGGFFSLFAWYDVIKYKLAKVNYFNYIMARYIRIMLIAMPILLIYFLLPQLGSGPLYSQITQHMSSNCVQNGYKTFLSITNIRDKGVDMCNPGNWYLSADSQIYLMSYFLTYYIVVRPKIGFAIAIFQIILNSFILIQYKNYFNLPTFPNNLNFEIYDVLKESDSYFPAIFHHNQYVLGILCAYLAKNKIKPKIIDYKIVRIAIWILVITGAYYISFWYPHFYEHTKTQPNKYVAMLYPIIDKFAFTLISFWGFYSLSLGYSKYLNKLASMNMWIPPSRLAFPISLSQFIYIPYSFASRREVYTPSIQALIQEVLNNVVFIFLLSNFIFLFVEAPLISLCKKYSGLKSRSEIIETNLSNEDLNNNVEKKKS